MPCSVGIVFADGRYYIYEDILHKADKALYEVKEIGKNTCQIFSSSAFSRK